MNVKYLLVLFACVTVAYATLGVDVALPIPKSGFQCMIGKNYTFAIVRAYRSNGKVDTNAASNIANAWAAGMSFVDIYMFPCPKCGNPAKQIRDMITNLNGARFGTLWLDIEGTEYWTDQASNRRFFDGLVQQAQSMGLNIGVYTSLVQWKPIMGDYHAGSAFPLWYARYNGKHSYSDFSPFGGWKKAAMKQYLGDYKLCGYDTDLNWFP